MKQQSMLVSGPPVLVFFLPTLLEGTGAVQRQDWVYLVFCIFKITESCWSLQSIGQSLQNTIQQGIFPKPA